MIKNTDNLNITGGVISGICKGEIFRAYKCGTIYRSDLPMEIMPRSRL